MNLFDLFARITLDDDDYKKKLRNNEKHTSAFADKLKAGFSAVGKAAAVGLGAAKTAAVALGKSAIEGFAEFEQLIGGTELMFGDAYDIVASNAAEAYKTVQMSQNEYLQQVNGFATGLKTALGGDEKEAANLAHRIIQAEADIVAATGNTAENVQNAFNGIMKSNFTMLDNLQIGITPTKEGFQEVIDKVNEWNTANGEATAYQMGNLADMQSALVDYIEMVGMSGYAQNEAAGTISGSIAMVKSAWSNLLTALADPVGLNLGGRIEELVEGIKTVALNVMPIAKEILGGIGTMVQEFAPIIAEELPAFLDELLPPLLDAGTQMFVAVLDGLLNNISSIADVAIDTVNALVDALVDLSPEIIVGGALLLAKLALGLVEAIPELVSKIPEIITAVVEAFKERGDEFKGIGKNIVSGVWEGIKSLYNWIKDKVSGFFSGIVGGVKDLLGIHSPSRVFAEMGGFMAEGLGEGWDKKYDAVKQGIEDGLHFNAGTVDFASSAVGVSSAGIINGFASAGRDDGKAVEVVLKLPDNTELARYYLPSFIDVARANGTPIANPL